MAIACICAVTLPACQAAIGDPAAEILEKSGGVIGRIVTLKTTPSLKRGSLEDAARDWQAIGWKKVNPQRCKDVALPTASAVEAYEIAIIGYAPENLPTRHLRLCAAQLFAPKVIAAVGFVVSTQKAETSKP